LVENPIILLVDDHNILRKTLYDWLMLAMQPCRVIEAESAEKAMLVMKNDSPDIVIMDIAMPGLNGIEATQQIVSCYEEVPVIMLSIYEEKVYQEASFRAGASAYVFKTEMREKLIPVLKQYLNGKNIQK
jgi:DNA-binding NarL/FixJ family response regulator